MKRKSEWRNKCGQKRRVELVLFSFQKRAVGLGSKILGKANECCFPESEDCLVALNFFFYFYFFFVFR